MVNDDGADGQHLGPGGTIAGGDLGERAVIERLASRLREIGYTTRAVVARLRPGAWDPWGIEAPYVLAHEVGPLTPLEGCVRLLAYQGSLSVEEAARSLSADLVQKLVVLGLLALDDAGSRVVSLVDVTPVAGRLFLTDPARIDAVHQPKIVAQSVPLRERVMYVGGDTLLLTFARFRQRVDAVLDLGCGCGVQAILAAEHAGEAIGVDTNPRALRFARLNAAMNDCDTVELLEGDLYEPIAGRRFDLVLANPPFVPSVEPEVLFRDGGPCGEQVLSRVLGGLAEHMKPGGVCQIVTDMMVRESESYEPVLRSWLGRRRTGFDILVARTSSLPLLDAVLARARLAHSDRPRATAAEAFAEQMVRLREAGVVRVDHGVITLRRCPSGQAGWFRSGEARPRGGLHRSLQRVLDRVGRLEDRPGGASHHRLRLREGAEVTVRRTVSANRRPGTGRTVLSHPDALWGGKVELPAVLSALPDLCDGSRTLGQLASCLGVVTAPAAPGTSTLLDVVRKLYERGVVDLVSEADGSA